MSLSDVQLDRYARHIVLKEIGGAGQAKLLGSRAKVIGAGGIGSPALLYLAAAGVGHITIIDDDQVALANLQRQILFESGDIGAEKAGTAAARIARLNPDVAAVAVTERITVENAARLLAGADIVIDGSDNFATRLAVADAAYALRVPLVSAAIGQFHGQIGTWRGWEAKLPCYRCYVGDARDAEDCDTCSEVGVLGAMAGLMGSFAAMEAVRAIAGFGDDPAGKLHILDGLTPSMRTIRMPKDPGCRTCAASSLTG
ncbi:MAG: HesA/MoeB/ThiF family protein [Sphingomonadaceae bacterium]|nr:HesA/MoeB/ThiF family protein [Sphingomonadaceae bacterium]